MTVKKYIGYSIEQLIEDKEFISTVKSIKTKGELNHFLELHQESRTEIIEAREIIRLFSVNRGKLDKEKKYNLWKDIRRFENESAQNDKTIRIRRYFRVAASILLIVSIGGFAYLNLHSNFKTYQFTETQNQEHEENPLLILSDGNQVELEKKESRITVLQNQNVIQINDDSIMIKQPLLDEKTNEVRFNEVIVPYGKKSKLKLSDGTMVWLNAGSRFAFPQEFNGKKREVFLEGEAYFEVTKDEKKPFVIAANNINIEVLGTKFNVSAYNSDEFIETVLLEGQINIWDAGKVFKNKVLMVPSQKATYSKVQKEISLEIEAKPEMFIAWIEGWYPFSNENLEQVFKKLERYYNIHIEYDQTLIYKALPVSGKLDLKDSLNEVMAVLSGVAKFDYHINGTVVKIVK